MSEILRVDSIRKRDIWLSILVSVLLGIASGFVCILVLKNAFPSLSKVVLNLMASIFILAVPIIYLSLRYGVIKITDFRLRGPDLVVLLISFVILVIVVSIISLEGPYKPYSLYDQTISELQRSERFIALLSIFFALPFLEETLFRRYIFEILRGGYKFPVALLLTALLDTGVHASEESLTGLVSIFFWEVFFTMIYFKSRLGVSIIIHCLTNFSLYHL